MATPNMNLITPTVGVTAGATAASNLVADLNLIDLHDHTSGNGVAITPSALNINSSLNMQDEQLIDTNAVSFSNQSATLNSSNVRAVYAVSGNLYYNNGSGTAVQITNGASVVGATGTISGLTGSASVSFSDPTYTFRAATANVAANLDCRDVYLRNSGASSNSYRVIAPDVTSGSTSITMPARPASAVSATYGRLLSMKTDGVMLSSVDVDDVTIGFTGSTLQVKDGSITSAKIANDSIVNADINSAAAIAYSKLNLTNSIAEGDLQAGIVTVNKIGTTAVTMPKLAAANIQYTTTTTRSATSSTPSAAAASLAFEKDASSGRIVKCYLTPTGSVGTGIITCTSLTDYAVVRILRDGVLQVVWTLGNGVYNSLTFLDVTGGVFTSGSHTYTIELAVPVGTGTIDITSNMYFTIIQE